MATGENRAIEFSPTEADFVTYSELIATRPWHKWVMGGLGGLLLFSVAIFILTSWETGEPLLDSNEFLYIGFAILVFSFPAIRRWLARRRFHSAAFARVRAPMRIEISPAGLRSAGGIADSLTPWSSIIDIRATPAGAYLFIFKNSAHIVPRHAFPDAASFDAFVAAARGWWRPGGAAQPQ